MNTLMLVLLVLVCWLLLKWREMAGRLERLEGRFFRLDSELKLLQAALGRARSEPPPVVAERTVGEVRLSWPSASGLPPPPAAVPQWLSPMPQPASTRIAGAPTSEEADGSSRPPGAGINWEDFLGVKLFAWVGGLALFLALAFFVKYSFDRNLIGPEMRVAIGYLLGAGLVAGGLWLPRERRLVTVHTLCATGVVILYTTTFAAHIYYGFLGAMAAFGLMALVTAAAFLLAIHLEAQVVGVLGLLGGFLTPPLLSTGVDNPVGLFGYLALLDLGLLAVVLRQRWCCLALLGALATALTQWAWVQTFFSEEKLLTGIAVFAGFAGLFVAAALVASRHRRGEPWIWSAGLLMPATALGFAFFLLLYPYPPLAHRVWLLFGLVFLADAGLLLLGGAQAELRWAVSAAGTAVFLLLGLWTADFLIPELLTPALAVYLVFAVLHWVLPLALERVRPSAIPRPVFSRVVLLSAVLPFALLTGAVLRLPLPDPSPVFGLGMVLAVLGLWLAGRYGAPALAAAGLFSVLLVEHAWHICRFTAEYFGMALGWHLGFAGLFLVYPFLFQRREEKGLMPWITAAVALPLHFWMVYRSFMVTFPDLAYPGLVPAGLALPCLLGTWQVARSTPAAHPERLQILAWFGGACLFFITLVFPIQFEHQWITLGWALEGVALLWLFHRLPFTGLQVVGAGLLVASFARLALNPAVITDYGRSGQPIFNWYLYSYGTVALCQLAAGLLAVPPRNLVLGRNVRPLFYALGAVLLFLLVNIEIADFFSPPGQGLTFNFSASFAQDMSYSLAWAFFAFALLILGFRIRNTPSRYAGMGLLVATLLKLFLHDLWRLGGLYRIGSLVGMALVLIVVSFIYQRFLKQEDRC